jgi:hypothetical protein
MPDIAKIKYALQDAENALRYLEFAIRLEGYCNRDPKSDSFPNFLCEFNLPHSCNLPEGIVTYNIPFSEKDIMMHTGMAISIALGVSAQIINRAYEQAGVKVVIPPTDPPGVVRFYINQIRNLLQHTVGDPTWDIIPKKQIVIELNINNKKFNIDFASLQGKEFEYSQIGGLRFWLDAADFAMRHIKSIMVTN